MNRRTVSKAYADVTDDERSPEDRRCTVCSEDQVTVDPARLGIDGVESFEVCWAYADQLESALRVIAASGEFRFTTLTGYRPGRTRGAVVDGLRQQWSNHSFGTAIDINAADNGLYRSCNVRVSDADSIAGCALGVGGPWNPQRRPDTTVTRDGVVFRQMTEVVGWRWGGDIDGSIRDLMHFSITGY